MTRGLSDAALDRLIERELTDGLSPRKRARLHARLREDEAARARYDRAVAALRIFEGDSAFAPSEVDIVGRWLADEWGTAPEAETVAERSRRPWAALAGALMAALVLLWVSPIRDGDSLQPWWEGRNDGWQARGQASTGSLGIEVLCATELGSERSLRVRECGLADVLGFAYRVEPEVDGHLTLFGVDAEGDPMFYAPTPVDAAAVDIVPGRWHAAPMSVRLSVNHSAGPLRVYALVSPSVPTVEQVREWTMELASQSAANPGDRPWVQRVNQSSLARVCPSPSDCHAAELALPLAPR
ncbi:MAG: hypothetical protein AAF799_32175 [Myxococcota bacterium]